MGSSHCIIKDLLKLYLPFFPIPDLCLQATSHQFWPGCKPLPETSAQRAYKCLWGETITDRRRSRSKQGIKRVKWVISSSTPFAKLIHLWFSALLFHGCSWALLKWNFRRKTQNPMTAWRFVCLFVWGGEHRSLSRVRFSKDESSLPFLY